ncbi:unnamed protein product, partial [Adineta steineri]
DSFGYVLSKNEHLSRSGLEKEIYNMVLNISMLENDKDDEVFYIADSYCHMDVLFENQHQPGDDIQIKAFSTQRRIAKEYNLPVVVTSRESFVETL